MQSLRNFVYWNNSKVSFVWAISENAQNKGLIKWMPEAAATIVKQRQAEKKHFQESELRHLGLKLTK